jgi:hypothetical protein
LLFGLPKRLGAPELCCSGLLEGRLRRLLLAAIFRKSIEGGSQLVRRHADRILDANSLHEIPLALLGKKLIEPAASRRGFGTQKDVQPLFHLGEERLQLVRGHRCDAGR